MIIETYIFNIQIVSIDLAFTVKSHPICGFSTVSNILYFDHIQMATSFAARCNLLALRTEPLLSISCPFCSDGAGIRRILWRDVVVLTMYAITLFVVSVTRNRIPGSGDLNRMG